MTTPPSEAVVTITPLVQAVLTISPPDGSGTRQRSVAPAVLTVTPTTDGGTDS